MYDSVSERCFPLTTVSGSNPRAALPTGIRSTPTSGRLLFLPPADTPISDPRPLGRSPLLWCWSLAGSRILNRRHAPG